jgi:hypothetical protein
MRMLVTRRLLAPSRVCRPLTTLASAPFEVRHHTRRRLPVGHLAAASSTCSSASAALYSSSSPCCLSRQQVGAVAAAVTIRRSLSGGSDPKNSSSSSSSSSAKSEAAASKALPSATIGELQRRRNDDDDNNNNNQQHRRRSGDVPRRIVVRRNGAEESVAVVDLANLKNRVGSLIPKKSRGYQRAVLRNRARASAAAAAAPAATASSKPTTTDKRPPKSVSSTPVEILPVPSPFLSNNKASAPLVPGTVTLAESADDKGRSGGDEKRAAAGPTSTAAAAAAAAAAEPAGPHGAATEPLRSKLSNSRIRLPVVNASALLDKQAYCVQSANAATSLSGTDAALRLHKGRQELIGVIRREILSQQQSPRAGGRDAASPSGPSMSPPPPLPSTAGPAASASTARPPPYYVLQGHGVPHQLLQAHIDFADSLLRKCVASDVSFSNSALKVDFVRKRRAADNSSKVLPWSAVASSGGTTTTSSSSAAQAASGGDLGSAGVESKVKWAADGREETFTQDMQLYLTVMNRIANALGLILPPSSKRRGGASRDGPSSPAPPLVDEYDNEWTEMKPSAFVPSSEGNGLVESATNGAVLKHWHAEFLRGRSVPPEWVPSSELAMKHPQPLVEWTPLTGMAAPGRVTIRLQGYPTSSPFGVAGTTTSSETTVAEDGSTTTITRSKPLRRRRSQPISLVFDACFRQV